MGYNNINKREIAKQIETSLVKIHCQEYTTMPNSEIKKVSLGSLKDALFHLKEAQNEFLK